MSNDSFDIVVIGAGPGGYVAAIRAAQLGMKVGVVEQDALGGICLNWGCIPTKALLRNAEIIHLLKRSEEFGIKIKGMEIDFSHIIKRSRDVAGQLSRGVSFLFKKNKIEHIKGFGRIDKDRTVQVLDKNGKILKILKPKRTILATGARPKTIPGVDIDGKKIISYFEAMVLEKIPKSMIIIGAGAIGVEFAYFYNALGTDVTIVEMLPQVLPLEDAEISKVLEKAFKKYGIKMHLESKVDSVNSKGRQVVVGISDKRGKTELKAEKALMAIGVQGNIENLGLEELGIPTEGGFVNVDEFYRTGVEGVLAIGDVIGPPLLAHVGSAEGITAVESIAGMSPLPLDYGNMPNCTFCMPQVASLGLTEAKAKEAGYKLKIGRFPFRANGKSLAYGEPEGLVKLIFDDRYGELLGAHIIGAEATELIASLGIGKTLETTFHEIHKTVHAHPTMSEAVMEAAADAEDSAIHI